jgi:hypothetical protein
MRHAEGSVLRSFRNVALGAESILFVDDADVNQPTSMMGSGNKVSDVVCGAAGGVP